MTSANDRLMQLLERRYARWRRELTRAWTQYKHFADYSDPSVMAKFKEDAAVASARLNEVRLTINAIKRLRAR